MDVEIRLCDRAYRVTAQPDGGGFHVSVREPAVEGRVERLGEHRYRVSTPEGSRFVWAARGEDGQLHVESGGEAFLAELVAASRRGRAPGEQGQTDGRAEVRAPMPARVVSVKVEPGSVVEPQQVVVVVEAMKMQLDLRSPIAGRVVEVNAAGDALTDPSVALVVIEA
jgi:biotin carboxyl carrier protein